MDREEGVLVTERFVVVSRRGEPGIRTNNPTEAARYAARIGGHVIDKENSNGQVRSQ